MRKGGAAKKKADEGAQPAQQVKASVSSNDLTIKDQCEKEIRHSRSEYAGKDNVIVESLENCKVFLPFSIKALYVKDVKDCIFYVGCVSGACFVNQAKNCRFYLNSHQIRIHNTTDTTFLLTAKSNPIIEHCSTMVFSKYRCTYPELEEDLKATGLHDVKNFWNEVLDFNWHKQDKSPNWRAASEEELAAEPVVSI